MGSRLDGSVLDSFTQRLGRMALSRTPIEDRPVTRMGRRIEMNFTYRGIIGGDSTHQINIWRRGKKHVAVFDCELPIRRIRRIRREMLLAVLRGEFREQLRRGNRQPMGSHLGQVI